MEAQSPSELVSKAERELAGTKCLIDEQYRRLKRLGADTKDAISATP
jgi:hypothetical protein